MDRRENEPIANDLKVSDSSGSDRNPLRLPSERLLGEQDAARKTARLDAATRVGLDAGHGGQRRFFRLAQAHGWRY